MPDTFKHPRVRDLAWVMGSPTMLQAQMAQYPIFSDKDCGDIFGKALDKLHQLEEEPAPLLSYLGQLSSHRVGRYFESLVQYWLEHLTEFEVIASNLQIKDGKQTLGEIDFLFREKTQLIHWETAVKYFLQLTQGCQEHEFIGPNTADNLASKKDLLLRKQLPRSTQENLDRELDGLTGTDSIQRQAFVKGWLFYHEPCETNNDCLSSLNPEHLRGFWIRHSQEELPEQTEDALWTVLTKPYWLAPRLNTTSNGLLTRDKFKELLQSHFNAKETPLLVTQLEPCNLGYLETLRGFIVSPQWPNKENTQGDQVPNINW